MRQLGFERVETAETGRPGHDPRDLLKLYLYGHQQQVRSSLRLEAECLRNVEVMWLLGRLAPDYKSIAEFRRIHREAVTEAGAELIRFARSVGLVRGEWVAIDGSKFLAVSSARSVRNLDAVETADGQEEVFIAPSAVAEALEKLKRHREPEAHFMRVGHGHAPAYNVPTAVDAEHALIVAQKVTGEATDNRSLLPMAEAAQEAVGSRPRCMLLPTPATPTANRPKPARQKASCRMCLPIAPSITRAMEHCSTALRSVTTRRPTRSTVRPGRHSRASNYSGARTE
jgi:transposase